jgi:hypothetical protein
VIDFHKLQGKKFERLKEKRYKNRNRESILTYEMMVTELESINDGNSSWILTKKKSEDDLNISNHIKNIYPQTKRENKSEEKEKRNIDLKIRKSILNDFKIKIQNLENMYKDMGDVGEYKNCIDVRIKLFIKIYNLN